MVGYISALLLKRRSEPQLVYAESDGPRMGEDLAGEDE